MITTTQATTLNVRHVTPFTIKVRAGLGAPGAIIRQPLAALADLLFTWQKRLEARDRLAAMDARLRRDLDMTPAQMANEAGKPFWRA